MQQARGRFPFELREGAKNSTLVVGRGETYALPEMSAFVLRRAKAIAERALGETVDRAVITVPANFNDLQRASTKVAGKLAGLEVLRILNEPTAAALAYGQTTNQNERLAVYDLGGGTFDITLLDLSGNVFEVLATAGDTALGGDDIDLVIADIMADQIVRTHRFDPRVDVTEFARLRIYAERLKQRLSSETEASIEIADLGMGEGGKSVTITFKMTREELEREIDGMIERTLDVCRFAIETVNLNVGNIDRVIMVGGPTRMPLIQRRVQDFFAKPPALKVNPDEVVALGAAIQAHVLDRGRKTKGATKAPAAMESPLAEEAIPRISAKATQAPARPPPVTPRGDDEAIGDEPSRSRGPGDRSTPRPLRRCRPRSPPNASSRLAGSFPLPLPCSAPFRDAGAASSAAASFPPGSAAAASPAAASPAAASNRGGRRPRSAEARAPSRTAGHLAPAGRPHAHVRRARPSRSASRPFGQFVPPARARRSRPPARHRRSWSDRSTTAEAFSRPPLRSPPPGSAWPRRSSST